jgi:hypothetical protein
MVKGKTRFGFIEIELFGAIPLTALLGTRTWLTPRGPKRDKTRAFVLGREKWRIWSIITHPIWFFSLVHCCLIQLVAICL